MSLSQTEIFINRVCASVLSMNRQGLRVQTVHISPMTTFMLTLESSSPFYSLNRPPGENLSISTPIGIFGVVVEPEMADDIFLLGLR